MYLRSEASFIRSEAYINPSFLKSRAPVAPYISAPQSVPRGKVIGRFLGCSIYIKTTSTFNMMEVSLLHLYVQNVAISNFLA